MPRSSGRPSAREIAQQRVQRLLELAERAALDGQIEDASRYGQLAWRLTTRHRLPANRELKARVCRGCKTYLVPNVTARVRLDGGTVSTTCRSCGRVRRVPVDDGDRS